MLKTFGEGDIYDYVDNGGEIQYPVMWVVPKSFTHSRGVMTYRLTLIFADLLLEDKENRLNAQSDQILTALDVLAILRQNYSFNISDTAQIELFQERFDDFTAGCSVDIEIIDPQPLSDCFIP